MQQGLDLIQIIHRGAIATYPLLLLSIISIAVVLDRLWFLRNVHSMTNTIAEYVLQSLETGEPGLAIAICKRYSDRPAGRIFLALLSNQRPSGPESRGDFATEAMLEAGQDLRRHLWILGTVASSAPFIGLLGTVIGIIKAFENMAIVGTGGFAVVAGGISEALVATAMGLGVAIIAVMFYNFFLSRIADLRVLFRVESAKILQRMSQ